MLVLRSLLFNFIMVSSVTVYALLSVCTFPFAPITRYRFISHWARFIIWVLKVLCDLDYVLEGSEHLPKTPSIILSKHQSTWETLAFQQIFPPQVWVLKSELLWLPFFGWGLAMTQPIAINRNDRKKAMDQIVEQGRDRLATGRCVVVFPEGTRVAVDEKRRYGIGGAVLAARTGYPVVPVAHNAGYFWPRRGFIKRPGTIRVVIGPTIISQGKTAEEIRQLVETWIETTMTRLKDEATRVSKIL